MKKAYQNMRGFWLDAANFHNKRGILEIGPEKIVAAGVEMAFVDGEKLKHVFVATNSLGDSSFYFENNSPSGLGGMLGGHGNQPLQEAAAHMLAYAGKLATQMTKIPAGTQVPSPASAEQVYLLAVSATHIFYTQLTQEQARNPENPFYPMFAYAQQVIGCFRTQDASVQQPPRA